RATLEATPECELVNVTVLVRSHPTYNWSALLERMLTNTYPKPHRLGAEECMSGFGADPADLERVARVLQQFDLEVVKTDPRTRSVEVRGTLAALGKAFQVELAYYDDEGKIRRGYEGPIHVPEEIADIVEYVFGLDNFPLVRRSL